jgi:hypothetical protein
MAPRQIAFFLAVIAGCVGRSAPPARPPDVIATTPGLVRVSGRATLETHYCAGGGARVTPEMYDQARRTAPITADLLVLRGKEIDPREPDATIRPDAQGRFTVELAEGTWCVFLASRRPIGPFPTEKVGGRDAACLEQVARTCDAVWTITGKPPAEPDIAIPEPCPQVFNQPCYSGPMPP